MGKRGRSGLGVDGPEFGVWGLGLERDSFGVLFGLFLMTGWAAWYAWF